MLIDIFDVGHGACAVITSLNGRRMMIDCGSNPERSWWPSLHFFGQTIDVLAISNYDRDHASDFSSLHDNCTVLRYQLNNSISAQALSQMKAEDGMDPGIQAIHEKLKLMGNDPGLPPLDFAPVFYRPYFNYYRTDFTETNNLSLVLILEYAGFKIIFPGDLELAGWRKLLLNPAFKKDLIGVDVFVASHHGRENGQCEEVLDICKPEITIMSDRDKEFKSQETVPWYRQRSHGIVHKNENRSVFTTRRDGDISISVDANGQGKISTQK